MLSFGTFFILRLEAKSVAVVLSSPKWILNLLGFTPLWNSCQIGLLFPFTTNNWAQFAGDFISCEKMARWHCPKWNDMEVNIGTYIYFIKTRMICFYWMGRFSQTTLETKFQIISLAMKSNVNLISFVKGWNFISARAHFHVNDLLHLNLFAQSSMAQSHFLTWG